MNIEIISGSGREASITHRIALLLKSWLTDNTSHHIDIIDVRDYDLPLLQHVYSSPENTPANILPLAKRMHEAHAFIWVMPEYNGTVTAAFKNLIDHFPKQQHKAVGIVTGSNGMLGGMRAAQQMMLLAAAMFSIASPQMLLVPAVERKIDAAGKLTDETFYNSVHNFVTEFIWLAEKIAV